MDRNPVSSEELYRHMANDIIYYLMGNRTFKYIRFFSQSPEEVYNAITTDTLCIAAMDGYHIASEVGSYLLWGNLEIQFLRLVPNHTVQMLWKLQSWPDSFFSRADIKIKTIDHFTTVEFEFSGFPVTLEECEQIWEQDVWRPIIDAFAYKEYLMRWAESLLSE